MAGAPVPRTRVRDEAATDNIAGMCDANGNETRHELAGTSTSAIIPMHAGYIMLKYQETMHAFDLTYDRLFRCARDPPLAASARGGARLRWSASRLGWGLVPCPHAP